MKAYGHMRMSETGPLELREVTLQVSPSTLRILAEFFNRVSNDMDIHGNDFGHEHFRDSVKE
jgi:hypothetical protein